MDRIISVSDLPIVDLKTGDCHTFMGLAYGMEHGQAVVRREKGRGCSKGCVVSGAENELIQAGIFNGHLCQLQMAYMRRVEGAPKETQSGGIAFLLQHH